MVGTRCVGVSRWSYLAPEASDGKVLCGHKPQSKPHLSEPGTHQRTWRVRLFSSPLPFSSALWGA